MCLSAGQLRAFIANMRKRMNPGFKPAHEDYVARATFVRCFLDALADASHLEPTAEEAEELFHRIAEEVGITESGEISCDNLYSSSLSSFLSDLQIYGIVSRFKHRDSAKQQGISQQDFVKCYPLFLGEVTQPDFRPSTRQLNIDDQIELGGLDVAFNNLSLSVTVGGKQVNVVDGVTGRLRSNTMTAVMGGSGSGKSSLLNALCGRAL